MKDRESMHGMTRYITECVSLNHDVQELMKGGVKNITDSKPRLNCNF